MVAPAYCREPRQPVRRPLAFGPADAAASMPDHTPPLARIVAADSSATTLAEALAASLDDGRAVIVAARVDAASTHSAALLDGLDAAGAATASPVPVASARTAVSYPAPVAGPPLASLPTVCTALCALRPEAVASVAWEPGRFDSAAGAVAHLGEVLHHHGWRHVAATGVALAWQPADPAAMSPIAGWTGHALASLAGPANAALEAQISWARSLLDPLRVVVDGACMKSTPYTGTQHVVLEVTRWLARTRPSAAVQIAAPAAALAGLRAALDGEAVEVVERKPGLEADVVYRPYQMLYAAELPFVVGTGRRGLVGQLDMIGFSNPTYHPSEQLLFFARNLQRHMMRQLDGVTFISAFGRDTAFAECPDLDPDRLHVVSCGADPEPLQEELDSDRSIDVDTPFLTCLSSTFWHKNRTHAIRTFAELVRRGYPGHLVIAGPAPYFGRSVAAEDALLESLPAGTAGRVHRWGQVPEHEKWWLLRHAQVVLYPSVIEGFGLVPFEAAAVGTPCLVPAQSATAELLGSTPAAVASWDPAVWADRVASLIAAPGDVETLVTAVRNVAARHTWEACARETWRAIDHALAAPRRAIHAEDGGALARVAGSAQAPAGRVRFDLARGVPAVRRRLSRIVSRHRSPGDA